MQIHIDENTIIDTERDLGPEERHVVQKLIGWKSLVHSVEEFRQKRKKALHDGWNNSGPLVESEKLRLIGESLERQLITHLRGQ